MGNGETEEIRIVRLEERVSAMTDRLEALHLKLDALKECVTSVKMSQAKVLAAIGAAVTVGGGVGAVITKAFGL